MRKIHILGLLVFAALSVGSVVVSSASAVEVPQWLVGGATIPLGTEIHVEILAEANTLLIEDMTEKIDVDCEPIGLGFVLSNGEGDQETGECLRPEVLTNTCANPEVKAVDLPWLTKMVQTGTVFEDTLKADGKGAPGWALTCTILGVKITDTCTTEAGLTLLRNEENGLVIAEFFEAEPESKWAECDVPKERVGLIAGKFVLHALGTSAEELETLAVNLAPEVS